MSNAGEPIPRATYTIYEEGRRSNRTGWRALPFDGGRTQTFKKDATFPFSRKQEETRVIADEIVRRKSYKRSKGGRESIHEIFFYTTVYCALALHNV